MTLTRREQIIYSALGGKKLPLVVIVGRINVGKSAIFNRLTDSTKALVSSIPGTTRDYNLGQVDWRKKTFQLIDTGGINVDILKNSIQELLNKKSFKKSTVEEIDQEIVNQTKAAVSKANLILMVVDGQAGLLPEDKELALVLKKLKTPIILACNKIDKQKFVHNINDFYKLGLGEPFRMSAASGSGLGDFLDEVVKKIKWPRGRQAKATEDNSIKVAVIGKPNVGKSSLVNKILGEKRVIVAKTPHTTRDPQDTYLTYKNQPITLIDTAGLRKKAKIESGLEKISTKKTFEQARAADVILLITEVDQSLAKQDAALAGIIKGLGAGVILVTNKWDLLGNTSEKTATEVSRLYKQHFPFLKFAKMIFVSAKTGKNVEKILDGVLEVYAEKIRIIDQKNLEKAFGGWIKKHRPMKGRGTRYPHLYGIRQTYSNPPEFTVTIGQDENLHTSYIRYLENQIRNDFGFSGVPVKIEVRNLKR